MARLGWAMSPARTPKLQGDNSPFRYSYFLIPFTFNFFHAFSPCTPYQPAPEASLIIRRRILILRRCIGRERCRPSPRAPPSDDELPAIVERLTALTREHHASRVLYADDHSEHYRVFLRAILTVLSTEEASPFSTVHPRRGIPDGPRMSTSIPPGTSGNASFRRLSIGTAQRKGAFGRPRTTPNSELCSCFPGLFLLKK